MDKIASMTADIIRLRKALSDIVNWKGDYIAVDENKPDPWEMAKDALLIDSPIGNNNGLGKLFILT